MKTITAFIALAICLGSPAFAVQPLRIDLIDGSQIYVESLSDSLAVTLEEIDQQINVAFRLIQQIEPLDQGRLRLRMTNGDRYSVRLPNSPIKLKAAFGEINIPVEQIRSFVLVEPKRHSEKKDISVTVKTSPPETSEVEFAGMIWDVWKTQWTVQDDQLIALGKIRPGFQYGHWANGRGGQVTTGNADQAWRDYEVAFDFHMQPASPEFFHAVIPGESRGMAVFFRCKSMTESWNEPDTAYIFGLHPNGSWGMGVYDSFHCSGFGWNENFVGKQDQLVGGKATPLNDDVNRFRIRVEGATFTVWLNDQLVTKYTHDEGGKIDPIPFGGIGIRWRFESLGWISNVSVEHL